MKKFNSVVMMVSKAIECIHWFAAAIFLIMIVFSAFAGEKLSAMLSMGVPQMGTGLKTYGFEMTAVRVDGTVNPTAVLLFSIGAFLIFIMMAMVFRNIYLILKTTGGKTSFSKGDTPFQNDNTRMVREIGIFYIAVPVIGLIMSIISRMILGVDYAEINVNLEGLISGIIILSLSSVFNYGERIQCDVDGLV